MQHYSEKQSAEASKVGKNVGMSDQFIPTSFPLSEQNVGTPVPTSRAALESRRDSKASSIVSLIIIIAYATLAVILYLDHQKSKAELDRAYSSYCESMDRLQEEMERNSRKRHAPPRNSLPPTPEEAVKH